MSANAELHSQHISKLPDKFSRFALSYTGTGVLCFACRMVFSFAVQYGDCSSSYLNEKVECMQVIVRLRRRRELLPNGSAIEPSLESHVSE